MGRLFYFIRINRHNEAEKWQTVKREGKHSEHDIDFLKERLLHTVLRSQNYPIETTHLFTTNASVNAHNNKACMLTVKMINAK